MKISYKLFINICIVIILLLGNLSVFATNIENTEEHGVQLINETQEITDDTKNIQNETAVEETVESEEELETIQIGDKPLIELTAGKVAPGEDVEISVYISSEKGISSAEFTIKYDNRLEYLEEIMQNEVNYTIETKKDEQKIHIAIANDEDIIERTLVTKLKFKVPEDATSETTYEVAVEKVDVLFSVQNGEIFNFDVANLLICVDGSAAQIKLDYTVIAIAGAIIIVVLVVFAVLIKKFKRKH